MIIEMIQQQKGLFDADFTFCRRGETIGDYYVQGSLGTMESSSSGTFLNRSFSLEYAAGKVFKTKKGKHRPYQIKESGMLKGEICLINRKVGWLRYRSFYALNYGDHFYEAYAIGIGKETKTLIFDQNVQIAQIDKELTVYDDLHHFVLYIKEEQHAAVALYFACYLYVYGCFQSGVEVKKSVVKSYAKTTNKDLLAKYDPDWACEIKE